MKKIIFLIVFGLLFGLTCGCQSISDEELALQKKDLNPDEFARFVSENGNNTQILEVLSDDSISNSSFILLLESYIKCPGTFSIENNIKKYESQLLNRNFEKLELLQLLKFNNGKLNKTLLFNKNFDTLHMILFLKHTKNSIDYTFPKYGKYLYSFVVNQYEISQFEENELFKLGITQVNLALNDRKNITSSSNTTKKVTLSDFFVLFPIICFS